MNQANPYLKEYKKNQIETATPEQILILLYNGAIQYLNKAKIALESGDISSYKTHIYDCECIIMEFMNSLNMEIGGKFAETLYGLYDYLYRTLVTVALSKEVEKIDEVLGHLTSLRETWLKAIDIANAERQANQSISVEHNNTIDRYESDAYSSEEDEDEDEYEEV